MVAHMKPHQRFLTDVPCACGDVVTLWLSPDGGVIRVAHLGDDYVFYGITDAEPSDQAINLLNYVNKTFRTLRMKEHYVVYAW